MAVIVDESPRASALTPRAGGIQGVDLRNASAVLGQEPGAKGPSSSTHPCTGNFGIVQRVYLISMIEKNGIHT